jgi:excisionase family DNA binding protein
VEREELLTAEELAERLKVSKQWIYNLSNPKLPIGIRLPSKKVGRLRRYYYNEVLRYFEEHSVD